ncbi:MAG TPA: NUDIX hydrolase [Methylomirabilota bacterium]|nr:NUDIX hydrolase [Methylomirabilota bacterium]
MELPTAVDRELDELARRFGRPVTVDAPIDDSFKDPIWKRDRFGEVCMVIHRRGGGLLLSIKTFYPRGAFRLPTGGIHHGEGVYDALVREAHEETGLVTTVDRFLARIAYHPLSRPGAEPVFHTFAFLLNEVRGTLGALDESERIEAWKEVAVADLPAVADTLDDLKTQGAEDIGGDWRAWGKFRAVVHRVVHQALTSPA